MVRILYIIAAIFIITWAIGFFFYSLGAIIHLFLVLAIIVILIRFFSRKERRTTKARTDSLRREKNVP